MALTLQGPSDDKVMEDIPVASAVSADPAWTNPTAQDLTQSHEDTKRALQSFIPQFTHSKFTPSLPTSKLAFL